MMNIGNVKKTVLNKIKPTKKEEDSVKSVTHMVTDIVDDLGYENIVVGSTGKHTWLKGDHDIDLFVLFPKDTPREQLEKKGLEIGRTVANKLKSRAIIKYAEHPYTQVSVKGCAVDIVPCYKIDLGEKIISAVDRSPLHLRYILEKLKPDQRDDVRLLKQFMKGAGIYGSDVKHLGFSGYVCELLIIKYGSFENALKQISKWNTPQIIDTDNDRNLNGALFMQDPVDPHRNVSAAVNLDNLLKAISYSKKFLSNPDAKMFFQKLTPLSKKDINILKNRGTYFIALISKRPDIIDDTLFPQLRKAVNRLKTLFEHEDFRLMNVIEYADNDSMVILFEFDRKKLPDIRQTVGPPIYSKFHTKEFLSKYKDAIFGPFILGDRWVVEIKRTFIIPEVLLKSFLKQDEQSLVKNGIPKNIAVPVRNSKIFDGDKIWKILKKNRNLSDLIRRKYFEKLRIL